MLRIDNN